jgi:hypothetical protein
MGATLARASALLALTGALLTAQVISPANPIVSSGTTLKFTADRPVTWSLAPGSAGTIDADGTYHAPASVSVPKALGGCQIGAADSVFNTRIDNLPVSSNSATYMAALPMQGITLDPSWGINVIDNTTPSQTLNFYYTPDYNNLQFQIPVWPALKRENGVFSDPLTGVDRHILSVNRQTCRIYEIYNNYPAGTVASTPPYNALTAQSGWQYDSMTYSLPTSGATDAAGLALAPTTLSLDDIRSGRIGHALRVTFGNAYLAPQFVWPATGNAYPWGQVPYGTRFRLKANFDISRFSPIAKVILTGLKQYGMLISDGGSNWDIVAATDLTEDRDVLAALFEIGASYGILNASQFEVVDESSLMVSAGSSQVNANNGYVTPPMFATVRADDGVHTPTTVAIALSGQPLNAPDGGGYWIQSGVTKKLSVFAGPTVPGVTWSMYPALGSLDPSSGTFIAPSVNSPTTTSVTATSTGDTTASVTFPVTVMPAGPIRIDAANATANFAAPNQNAPNYGPDSNGNIWWKDQAVERGQGVDNDYRGGP